MKFLITIFILGTSVCFAQSEEIPIKQDIFPRKENYFLGIGPAIQSANGSYFGPRVTLGVSIRFTENAPFVLDFSVVHPFFHEQIQGKFSGLIHRWYGFLGLKKYFTDDWYGLIRLGLGTIHNSNPSQPFFIKPVYGASVGRKIWKIDDSKSAWIDLSYDYMPTVRFNSVLAAWFCATGSPLGDNPQSCENQSISFSHMFSINGFMTFDVN